MGTAMVVVGLLYLGLGVVVLLRGRRTGQPALRRLGPFLLAIAVVVAGVPLLAADAVVLAAVAMVGGLAAYPVLLLRFGAALIGDGAPLERAALLVLVVEFAYASGSASARPNVEALVADMTAFAVCALLAHVVVQVVLVRQVRSLPSTFVRRRAISMSAGFGLLMLTMAGSVVLDDLLDLPASSSIVGAVVAVALLAGGASPPRWLQAAYLRPDLDALVTAESELFTTDDHLDGLVHYVREAAAMFGSRIAWLEHDGTVVAHLGPSTAPPEPATASAVADDPAHPRAVTTEDGTWLLVATAGASRLTIRVGRDPAMYGLDVETLLPRLASQLDVALRAWQLEERRSSQARAEQQAEHYRQVVALKDDLLSTINHELRTPLLVVTGGLDLVAGKWEAMSPEQQRSLIERVRVNAQHLAGVVGQVLQLVSLRTGETVVRSAPVALQQITTAVREGLDREAIAQPERLAVVCGPDTVETDGPLVTGVVTELVDNAMRHTSGAVVLRVTVEDDRLCITVEDEGDGLPPELIDTFSRGGNYLHRETRGLGLGWSVVTETVQLLGGRVCVEQADERDGRGTRVVCTVPLGVHVEASAATGSGVDGAAGTR